METDRVIRIARSLKDVCAIAERDIGKPCQSDEQEFIDKVVLKPWGYEYLLFNATTAAGWTLFLQNRHSTSMHCHPNKSTTLVVLDGAVECNTLSTSFTRHPGDIAILDPGTFHQTFAVSTQGAVILEIETPNMKRDLVRLNDAYGRENSGYESREMHLPCMDGQTTLTPPKGAGTSNSSGRKFGATSVRLLWADELEKQLFIETTICVLEGGFVDSEMNLKILPGHCVDACLLRKKNLKWLPGTLLAIVSSNRLMSRLQRFRSGVEQCLPLSS